MYVYYLSRDHSFVTVNGFQITELTQRCRAVLEYHPRGKEIPCIREPKFSSPCSRICLHLTLRTACYIQFRISLHCSFDINFNIFFSTHAFTNLSLSFRSPLVIFWVQNMSRLLHPFRFTHLTHIKHETG